MKIFKQQIPVRHILYVVLGWLHATMLCVPLYALVLNFVSEGMTKDVILQNILRGFLILAPIALSWFAIKCLRRIFFYILASIGITVLTGFLFDSVLMAACTAKAILCLTTPAMRVLPCSPCRSCALSSPTAPI